MSTLAEKNAVAVAQRRAAERVAAFEFLTTGASDGPAPDGAPWSRDYDPVPYPEAVPHDLRMYEGTGVGALYGHLDAASRPFFADLAGWSITRRKSSEALRNSLDRFLASLAEREDA